MKILFLSSWFPYPPNNGSRIRIFNLIKQLSKGHDIALLSFSRDEEVTQDRLKIMQRYCSLVRTAPLVPFRPSSSRAMLGLLSSRPRSLVDTYSPAMQKLVERAGLEKDLSVVIASQIVTAPYAATLEGIPRILEEVELTVLREKCANQSNVGRRLRYGLMWWKVKRFTAHLLRRFEGCTVVSQQERALVLSVAPNCRRVTVVPNGVDVEANTGDFGVPKADTLIYSGALTYSANFDAIEFFLRDIFPRVRVQCPNVSLCVTGSYDGVPVERLPLGSGVKLTGYLDDVRPAVAQSWVCVVPLRVGGGTRLKILEAMALGTPVVSTSKGAEGLEVTHEENILIADDPGYFAQAVLRLLKDESLRATLSINGRRLVEERYSWGICAHQLEQLLQQVVTQGPNANG